MRKRNVIVLGMHRSGTSVLSKGLQVLGVSIGSNLLEGNEWNPKGYFEHADIVRLNDTLLGLAGARWDTLALPPSEITEPLFGPYEAEALALLERDFSEAEICGLKDPRVSRLLPFWQTAFRQADIQDCYVIALRNPISVALSLAARNGFRPEKSYLLWLSHLFAAIKDTKHKPRIVVDYDDLIADPAKQLERIASRLNLPVSEKIREDIAAYSGSFLSGTFRHSAHDPLTVREDPRISELVGRTYDLLRQLSQDGEQGPDDMLAFEREWSALEETLNDIAPIFRYLDECEDRIETMTLNPETLPVQAAGLRADTPIGAGDSCLAARADLRVSVVIPLFNHEQYIEAAIESVLAQTIRPSEIIVIDDGSSDNSAAKVLQLAERHPEIIFWSWPNQGAHHTLNASIHRATGDYVAILNSDDCYEPERLAACLSVVSEFPAVDVVSTRAVFMDKQGREVENVWYEDARKFYLEESDLSLALFHANLVLTTSNLFIRRSIFDSIGYFSQLRYAHDLEYILRLILAKAHIRFLDRPLLRYRWHGENTITENHARVDIELAAIYAYFLYRQRLVNGASGEWYTWLQRYIKILGQKKLLETVEYFIDLLEGGIARERASILEPIAAEFHEVLAKLGVDWVARDISGSLLAQFADARNAMLRRWGLNGGNSKTIAELAKSNAWLQQQREAWESVANERAQSIAALQQQLQEQAKSNAWLQQQREAWESVANERAQSIAALQQQLQEQAKSNAWLQQQREAWESVANERAQSIAALQQQLQEQAKSNAWLQQQREAWESVANERARSNASLIETIEQKDALLSKIRNHRGMKIANFLSKTKLL